MTQNEKEKNKAIKNIRQAFKAQRELQERLIWGDKEYEKRKKATLKNQNKMKKGK